MADDIADMIGIPADKLESLLSQLGPTPQMRQSALTQGLLAAGLGTLASRGNFFQTAGQGGLLGLNAYQGNLQTQMAQRGQDLTQLMALRNAAMQQKAIQGYFDALHGDGGQQTQAGAPQPFQSQGGAAGLMNAAASGQAPPVNSLPTQVQAPQSAQSVRDRLATANLYGHLGGLPDMSTAINTKFPLGIAARAGAPIIDPSTGMPLNPNAAPPPGTYYDPRTNSFVPVANGQQAIATSAATPKAVDLAFTPQKGVIPGGGEGIVGNVLQSTFPSGQLPYGAPPPFGAQQPTGQAQSTPARVQTKQSPEQEANSRNLGEELAASRTAAAQSSKAQAELGQIAQTLNYFTPGPWMPMRSSAAGVAQQFGPPGRAVADALVPNSATALPAIAAMEKLTVGLTAEQSKVFGSREGQQVIGMIKSAMPNAAMVPGAPETIVNSQMAVHQWFIDRDAAMQQWLADPKHNGSTEGFAQVWNADHPVSSYIPDLPALKNIAEGKPPNAPRAAGSQQATPTPALTPAGQANPQVRAILQQNLTPAQIQALRAKGYVQ